jgi:osmotically-inducible protein OsmY
MKKLHLTLICSTIFLLSGCMTSVVSSGASAAYDHHNLQTKMQDQYLYVQVDRAIHWTTGDKYKNSHVSVSAFNGAVILTGQVENEGLRADLETIAKTVPDVDKIYNLTTVEPRISSLAGASDGWITTKIKSKLMAEIDIDPSQIKVITENGTVYMIGTLYPYQAEIATDIAKKTSGVGRVVKVFSYLHVTKSPELNPVVTQG